MAKGKFFLFLSAVAIAMGLGVASPRAADDESDCTGSPERAVMTLPAPLRKWGHISCTQFGHMLTSRQGWVWAWLDGSGNVAIPSQMVRRDPARLGNESYFATIEVTDLDPEKMIFAFSVFHDGLTLDEGQFHGYRVNLVSVSGKSTTIYFFDFDTFAGGIWCPDDGCVPESRFMIMEKDHQLELRHASI